MNVYVLDNRRTVWDEMRTADEKVRSYLIQEFKKLHANPYIEEWVDAHAGFYSPSSSSFILDDLENFIA